MSHPDFVHAIADQNVRELRQQAARHHAAARAPRPARPARQRRPLRDQLGAVLISAGFRLMTASRES